MPRLFHRPPKYRLHKSTKQAVVSFFGRHIYLAPFGSQRSLQRYQELLNEWEQARHRQKPTREDVAAGEEPDPACVVAGVTAESLREQRLSRAPVLISELILVYRQHTREYYRKNGEVTREAGAIDDALRILRKHYGMTDAAALGRRFQAQRAKCQQHGSI